MTNEEIAELTSKVTFGNATLDRLQALLAGVEQWPSWEFCELVTEIWVNLPAREHYCLRDKLYELPKVQRFREVDLPTLLYKRVDPHDFRQAVALIAKYLKEVPDRDPYVIREWAHAYGYKVSDRGRLPKRVLAAYEASALDREKF